MNISNKISFKNEYFLKQIDTITGEVKQDLKFHNTICFNNVFNYLFNPGSSSTSYRIDYIAIGNGSGIPKETDNNLFSFIKRFKASRTSTILDNNTKKESLTYTIPAIESEVYDITEIGVSSSSILYSHAMVEPVPIHKESTDIIILTCNFYITMDSTIENFHILNNLYMSNGTLNPRISCYIKFNDSCGYLLNNFTNYTSNLENKTKICSPSGIRLDSHSMPVYIKKISFSGMGDISLPNEDIFPSYALENIVIGVGDGETTEFKCPLNYFKKGTEKIYIDGILQNKDTYTIDNEANQDELLELSAGNDADITGGNTSDWNPTNANNTTKVYVPIFKKIFCGASEVAEKKTYSSSFQLNKPLIFNFGTKRKINKIRIPYGYFKDDNGIYTLYGRNSEEDKWNLITSFSGPEKVFNIVEYQYIQLTSNITNSLPYTADRPSYVNRVQNTICTTLDTVEKCKNLCFLGYVGEGIKFITPPSQESVITMSANTDIPFIGPNSVLDFQTTMTFKFK